MQFVIGFISGIFSGMGYGGGTILILFLSIFFNIEQHLAQAVNFIFFIPTSIIASFVYYKNKQINLKLGLGFAISGIIGWYLGASFSLSIGGNKLRKYFGIFLAIISIFEIFSFYKTYIKNKENT